MKRREFLKTATLTAAAAGLAGTGLVSCSGAEQSSGRSFDFTKLGTGRLRLSFQPYELQLRHTFTVSSYSRKTTPGVQVKIDYEGYTGYGEASMPPYLGQSVETVCNFLQKVDMEQFRDPFRLEDILAYVDSLSP